MRSLCFVALALSSSLSALSNVQSRVERLETQMDAVRMQTVYGNYGAQTATAYPILDTYGLFFSVEALCMKLSEGGLDYAYQEIIATTSTPYIGHTRYLDFGWRPAFRLATGYQFKAPDWGVWLEYMRYATIQNDTTHKSTQIDSNLYSGVTSISSTSLTMSVAFNTLDLNLGRHYFLRRDVSVHPSIGLRSAWIDQTQSGFIHAAGETFLKQKNNYGGIGIRTGSQMRWHLTKNWNLFGSLAGALMWGQFSNNASLSLPGITLLDLNLGTRRILPNMVADAGFSWEYPFAKNRSRVTVSLAYEFDYWWRQNQMIHIDPSTTYTYYRWSEDLSLQGLKLNLCFDF